MSQYALGIDYGTNSVRALIVDVATGEEIASDSWNYAGGEEDILLDEHDPNLARQRPIDYQEGFGRATMGALKAASEREGFLPDQVIGIGVDTTGSTPIPVDEHCVPLGMKPEFRQNLAAQAWLWKDHTAFGEAAEIT